jgi:DNA-binding transcriptional MerR regulator
MDPADSQKQFLGTRDAARLAGCSERTLANLADRGVIAPAKTSTQRRIYTLVDVKMARAHLRKRRA